MDKKTIKYRNADMQTGSFSIIPKEVVQQDFIKKIGSTINYCGALMKIKDVRITDEFILIDVESVK